MDEVINGKISDRPSFIQIQKMNKVDERKSQA